MLNRPRLFTAASVFLSVMMSMMMILRVKTHLADNGSVIFPHHSCFNQDHFSHFLLFCKVVTTPGSEAECRCASPVFDSQRSHILGASQGQPLAADLLLTQEWD